ncbi:uncharacterized protein C8R40DRAFT_1080645 [Lentinula edodes]|uniref:uncharacterized protein n=1 Tax=Lentinula edodes TaxID=5353 RepID=UPI001E8D6805|nr:uncharacterized protein C8R40DRAFT_1080645 [Lentinula edodes]KAH7880532.1 hypothetical protein C8R40DRAFT_1080645 [Lentinula edodes]
MILEPPSDVTIRAKTLMEQKALTSTIPAEKALLASSSTDPPPKKKRGPKGPNPLSIKKKKASNMPTQPVKSLVKVHSDGKSKGKGISIGKLVEGDGEKHVSNEISVDTGKRKRTEESEADATVEDSNIVIAETTSSSRKRKRRRKAKE